MRILELLDHLGIAYMTEGHKHCRPGWVNMPCPFCSGNPGMHLGYDMDNEYFKCWRCGWHRTGSTLSKLSGMPLSQVLSLMGEYGGKTRYNPWNMKRAPRIKGFQHPSGTGQLSPVHRAYLEKRKFDPEKIEAEWGVLGTGPVSLLDGMDYKHRILCPIRWDGQEVSFQCRSIRDNVQPKYKACPKERELIHHQHILYGNQSRWGQTGICVEGVTDVWRLGEKSFAVFGIEFTLPQIRKIAQHFSRVAVVFDDDPQATVQVHKLIAELRMYGVDAWWVPIIGDPGGMGQADADAFVKDIL